MAKGPFCHIFSLLSNSFLRILVVPNKAAFYNSPFLMVTPSFSSQASNFLLTTPSAPTTSGTTPRCLIPHSLPICLFRSWYFLTFSGFLYIHSMIPGWSSIHYDCLVIFLLNNNNVRSSGLDRMVKLDGHIPQVLAFFVFPYPFRLLFIPFLTTAHVILATEFPVDQAGNIVVSSLVLSLCQHLTFTY